MSSDIAIKVEGLSKSYQIYDRPHDRLKQMFFWGRRQYYREFWALRDVSFEVKRGETVGIIGRNGSGKSTLLQLICGTLNPTGGQIMTNGRIAALLELGTGFNPDFTGRENVYMNAAVLGLSTEEIDDRFDAIASFADIGAFLDQPVKRYSSGMIVRLAFAVQAQVEPEILIVDEALSVGDVKFQVKCFERLKQLKDNGTSILLVTHASEQIVTHCTNALLLDHGKVIASGAPKRVVNTYVDLLFGKERKDYDTATSSTGAIAPAAATPASLLVNLEEDVFHTRPGYNEHEYRWGDRSVGILDFFLCSDEEAYPASICTGTKVTLQVSVRFHEMRCSPVFGMTIKTKEGVTVYGINSDTIEVAAFRNQGKKGKSVVVACVFDCRLAPGDYFISLGVASRQGEDIIPHDRRYDSIHIHVRPDTRFFGLVDLDGSMEVKEIVV
jgi:lipopolysaccharide transport system ATP-binding protein